LPTWPFLIMRRDDMNRSILFACTLALSPGVVVLLFILFGFNLLFPTMGYLFGIFTGQPMPF